MHQKVAGLIPGQAVGLSPSPGAHGRPDQCFSLTPMLCMHSLSLKSHISLSENFFKFLKNNINKIKTKALFLRKENDTQVISQNMAVLLTHKWSN